MKAIKIFSCAFWFFVMLLAMLGPSLGQAQGAAGVQQFTAGGHVLGFQPVGIYFVSGDHLLKVTFVGANRVTPIADQPQSPDNQTPPLGKVIYPSLWDGISLSYEPVAGGIAKSTYRLEAGADAGQIRLRYNVAVQVNAQGKLIFDFETGQASESVPIAWQEIDGQRSLVSVSFCKLAEREVGFMLGAYNTSYPLVIDPTLQWQWNTFLGSSDNDEAHSITIDVDGNVYVAGYSYDTWGSPVNPYTGLLDAFVAKLNHSGVLQWHTFLGSSGLDYGRSIVIDDSGNVYVTGESHAAWGSPVNAFAGGYDAFVAKLNTSGSLQWHTFLGSSNIDYGYSVAVDSGGNVYVAGHSNATWGVPINSHTKIGYFDAFVAKLDNSGALQWNTFLGSSNTDYSSSIVVDGSGNLYLVGYCNATWGSPVNPYTGLFDAFVAKLNNNGALQWHTFLGSTFYDYGYSIAIDFSDNVYVAGTSYATWGSPVNPHASYGYSDAFVAKLDNTGSLQWNTFLGSTSEDKGYSIVVDGSGNVYVAGSSRLTWGSPVNAHAGGGDDAFIAKTDNSGALQGNTFLGSLDGDYGYGIAVEGSGIVYMTGYSNVSWGMPIIPHAGNRDAFVTKLGPDDIVPVELVSFSATSNGHLVTLIWSTATETDNYGFEVQRKNQSDDDWKQIGLVMGNGTTAVPHNYSFVDDHISVGVYSYRLKQIDFDGRFEFTDEILIEVKSPSTFSLDQNYPNPFNPETAISFSIKEAGKVSLKIYNLQGQVIRTLVNEEKSAGNYLVMWNGTDDNGAPMVSGVYYYTLKVNGFAETKKLIFMK